MNNPALGESKNGCSYRCCDVDAHVNVSSFAGELRLGIDTHSNFIVATNSELAAFSVWVVSFCEIIDVVRRRQVNHRVIQRVAHQWFPLLEPRRKQLGL